MDEELTIDAFNASIEEIVSVSKSLMDNWEINLKEGVDNGRYLTKKSTVNLANQPGHQTLVTFEYHVAFNLSYGVPVLCFNIWRQDGSFLSLEQYWELNERLNNGSNMYDTLTQMDHPVLCRPFLTLHPCRTREILRPFFEKSKNLIISWLSVVGPCVHLELAEEYFKKTI